ncbi:sigma-70 family RNA polymerase sigma factor [bacterium]|nr:sigma-70 family RNA polymerase sigma factor [bacterium]
MKGQLASDRELVAKMLSGDERAFEAFFNTYFAGLFRFVVSRLGKNGFVAEEVVQNAMCKAVSKLSTYRGEAALFTWLCTFCRHEISQHLKQSNGYEVLMEDDPEILAALESLLIAAERPDKAVLRKELIDMVRAAMNALPDHYAKVLEWKYIDGLAIKEIAEKMNIGIKAAESLMTRARQSFRDAFLSLQSRISINEV